MKKTVRLNVLILTVVLGCFVVNAQTNKKPRILVEKGAGYVSGMFGIGSMTYLEDHINGTLNSFGRAELVSVDNVQSEKLKTKDSKCSDELLEEARKEGFDYVINFSCPTVKHNTLRNSWTDKKGQTHTTTNYTATATYVQYIYDTNSKKIINQVSVDNQSSGTSNVGLDANAMDKANKYFSIYFRRFLNRTFPVICKVTDIIPGEKKKDKKVVIDAGENRFVSINDEFNVFYDKEKKGEITKKKVGSLKVISIASDSAICEIDGGGSKIEKFLKDGTLLVVTDDPNYKKSKGESDDEDKD